MTRTGLTLIATVLVFSLALGFTTASRTKKPKTAVGVSALEPNLRIANQNQTPLPKLDGCVTCHGQIEPMHKYGTTETLDALKDGKDAVGLTCTGCHGGNPVPRKTSDDPKSIQQIKNEAHVRAKFPNQWQRDGKYSGANPERTNTLLARESWEFVRFINPGDLRVAAKTCGGSACHDLESKNVARSMMTHGAMLWGAALYNNGGFPLKDVRFGESYSENGAPQTLIQNPKPTAEDSRTKGLLEFLDPIPRWEISQPGNVLRVFERGGKRRLEVGLPDKEEDPGKPDKGLSARGFGSAQRTDPVYLGLQKTRLLDPTLNFLGTNDHPGDYRSSGCSACHVIYANDRDASHSAAYHDAGNSGRSQTSDVNIPKNESGHPIKHQFTSQIPTSQCMTCHMHPGTNMVATYLGMTWWDNESEATSCIRSSNMNRHRTRNERSSIAILRQPACAVSGRGLSSWNAPARPNLIRS